MAKFLLPPQPTKLRNMWKHLDENSQKYQRPGGSRCHLVMIFVSLNCLFNSQGVRLHVFIAVLDVLLPGFGGCLRNR